MVIENIKKKKIGAFCTYFLCVEFFQWNCLASSVRIQTVMYKNHIYKYP